MPSPQSADTDFDQEHMEHVVLLNRAFADGVVSPDEAEAIRRHYFEELTPAAEDLSVSFRAIHSITRSKGGIYGYRFQRMCKQAWSRRGESNVVDLFPRVPMDAA